jgi:hypothetical protein
MRLSRLKSPRFYLPTALVLLLGLVSAVVFHPAFQKKMLQDHVGPLVDSLDIGYVHLTPWSLEMRDVSVGYRGGHFSIGHGTLRYGLFALLLLDVNVKALALKDLSVDLEKFTPPEAPASKAAGPFPGVLASLQHGLGYRLGEVAVAAVVRLPGQRSVTAHVTGGGIKPKSKGEISFDLCFDSGHQDDHIEVDGTLALDQLTRGRFAAVKTALATQITLAALPQTEHANLELVITPAAPAISSAQVSPPAADDEGPRYAPEALRLSLRLPDAEGNERSALNLVGTYDGNTGRINGSYRATANERLLGPYLKKATMPPARDVLTGQFAFDSASLTGNMTVTSDLAVKDIRELHPHEGLPEGLQLKNNFRLSLLPGKKLRVETLDSELFDTADQKRLESSLAGDLHIALDDPAAFLHQKNTLLDFTLPGVPLAWFNVLMPGYNITDGTLTGAFEVSTDTNAAIHLKPLKPLQIKGLTVIQQDKALVEGLNLSVLPGMVYGGDALAVSMKELAVDAGQGTLATADLAIDIGLALPGQTGIATQATAKVDLHRLLDMLAIKPTGVAPLPLQLGLAYQAKLHQRPGLLRANQFDATVSLNKTTELLQLHLLQPLVVETAPAFRIRGDTTGELAALKFSDIDLNWFSAFVTKVKLKGVLSRAELTVAADDNGVAALTSSRPVDIRHVTLSTSQGALLGDLGIRMMPNVRFDPEGTRVDYRDLEVTSHQAKLVWGAGQITLPGAPDRPLLTDGHLDADLQVLSKQPFIVRALQASVDAPVRLKADYRLAQGDGAVDIDRLSAKLFYDDPEPRLSLHADSNLRIRTQLGGRQSELERTTGKVTVALTKLTPEPFANILKARGLAFTQAEGKAELVSDGRTLTVNTVAPFVISGITVRSGDAAVLNSFTLTSKGGAAMEGNTLQAAIHECSIAFAGERGTHALDAHGTFTLKGVGSVVTLDTLKAELSASLPPLLDQPAALPGHGLKKGTLTASLQKDADGKLNASARIVDLKAEKPLALRTLSLDVNGYLAPDGGFNLSVPLNEQGKSGTSDIQVEARFTPDSGSAKTMDIDIGSSVFFLNDILNAVQAIDGKKPPPLIAQTGKLDKEKPSGAEPDRVAPDLKPDERAFWNTDYEARLRFKLDRLFYTDYLEFRDIQGHVALLTDRLELGDFSAHFHDSPITLDGRMTFNPGQTPYDLKLQAGVEQFDLAKFFRELVPGSTPRAEGFFDISLDAFGASPNLAQYRNNLYFDMRLLSQEGVFRPFDPDSSLLASTSGIAGLFGEGVSNLPTGLFGLGAVSRLVNYMKEIDYDRMEIHLGRDQSRDVQIKEYVVQSPGILMTATGGITYQEGVDIVDSPVSVEARLDMRERGAAILYSLGLLKSEKDTYGYWKGPTVKVWGNIAQTKSNLDEIISTAGRSAVLGGVTRPVSGLWGNLKFWWFGGGKEPTEYEKNPGE